MRTFSKKIACIMSCALVAGLFCVTQADAAIRAGGSFTADETGVVLDYNIPVVGFGRVDLPGVGATDSITVRLAGVKLADVDLELIAINTDNETVDVQFSAQSPLAPGRTIDGVIPVPFGSVEFGAVLNIMGRLFIPIGDHDVDISVLISRFRTKYAAVVDLPPIVDDFEVEGLAQDNEISIEIPNLATLNFTLEPGAAFTQVTYSIELDLPAPEMPDMPEGGEIPEITIPPIEGGPIAIPNGSYHIWFDLDIDLEELLGPPPVM